ncbi:MAG: hypothetical protein GQ538_08530, partial [Xanthomonadales bacterium]|nr:hypothetical protein [Xanthomonadales bacterium]
MTRKITRTSILLSAIYAFLVSFQSAVLAAGTENPALACPGPSLAPRFKKAPDREN